MMPVRPNEKLKQERDAEQHRRVESQFSAPHRSQPVEDFDARRNALTIMVETAKKVLLVESSRS
jgi:hypothetical protein